MCRPAKAPLLGINLGKVTSWFLRAFTKGIAVLILSSQIKPFLGLQVDAMVVAFAVALLAAWLIRHWLRERPPGWASRPPPRWWQRRSFCIAMSQARVHERDRVRLHVAIASSRF